MKRLLPWLATNGTVIAGLAYVTFWDASVGIERLVKFPFIFFAMVGWFIACREKLKSKKRAMGRPVHRVVSHLVGAVYVLWLVYLGFWVTMVFATLNELAEVSIHDSKQTTGVANEAAA